jgi:hypothetical protein
MLSFPFTTEKKVRLFQRREYFVLQKYCDFYGHRVATTATYLPADFIDMLELLIYTV